MATVPGAREGDWKCGGCDNRNYAFRSMCNRCKQPRLLVDPTTPADSKWLPRIGDWICAGCSNNNYASREKCNKCGQAKEVAAVAAQALSVPALTMAAVPTAVSPLNLSLNMGMAVPMSMPIPMSMSWPWSTPGSGGITGGVPSGGGWRIGDWICTCGFHNYSSRLTCKQCHTPSAAVAAAAAAASATPLSSVPSLSFSAPGTKRLASIEAASDWASKRQNMGSDNLRQQNLQAQLAYGGWENSVNYLAGQATSAGLNLQATSAGLNLGIATPGLQAPALLGKGAKQWRVGDWMCTSCSNHNFASRDTCNRCGNGKIEGVQTMRVS